MGGDNVIFWGPLAKTVIYGLLIATFLTLIVVPILFFLITKFKMRIKGQLPHQQEKAKLAYSEE
jgi:Cu/Ag efflux pump CusA